MYISKVPTKPRRPTGKIFDSHIFSAIRYWKSVNYIFVTISDPGKIEPGVPADVFVKGPASLMDKQEVS